MFSMFTSPQKLHAKGIMGMNKRNGAYIGRYNDRSKYPLVDDKLKTKIIAQEHGATVPKLIGVIGQQAEVKRIHTLEASLEEVFIKFPLTLAFFNLYLF